jgi:hypothetical protein
MQAFFNDPDLERLPPDKMRWVNLSAEVYPDGRRIRLKLEFTPFLKSPVLELTLRDAQGNTAAATTIIEPFTWHQELTMHLRDPRIEANDLRLDAVLLYPDLGEIDRRELAVSQ